MLVCPNWEALKLLFIQESPEYKSAKRRLLRYEKLKDEAQERRRVVGLTNSVAL